MGRCADYRYRARAVVFFFLLGRIALTIIAAGAVIDIVVFAVVTSQPAVVLIQNMGRATKAGLQIERALFQIHLICQCVFVSPISDARGYGDCCCSRRSRNFGVVGPDPIATLAVSIRRSGHLQWHCRKVVI